MSASTFSQDLSAETRLAEIGAILARAVARRRREVKSIQRVMSANSAQTTLAIFSETSLSVPIPAGERREIGDDA